MKNPFAFVSALLPIVLAVAPVSAVPVEYPMEGKFVCSIDGGERIHKAEGKLNGGQYTFTIDGHERSFRHFNGDHSSFWVMKGSAHVWSFINGNKSMHFFRTLSKMHNSTELYYDCWKK